MLFSESELPPATTLLGLDGKKLDKLRGVLASLGWSDFYTQLDEDLAGYRATPDAIATFGHANITHMIVRMTPHGEGERAQVKIDRIPSADFTEHLILLRFDGEPAVHALTESEYRAAMLRLAP